MPLKSTYIFQQSPQTKYVWKEVSEKRKPKTSIFDPLFDSTKENQGGQNWVKFGPRSC